MTTSPPARTSPLRTSATTDTHSSDEVLQTKGIGVSDDEQRTREHEPDDADTDASGSGDDPNTSTEGVLDEETLRAHASEVEDAINEARRRNG
jgi:hypothetical protein